MKNTSASAAIGAGLNAAGLKDRSIRRAERGRLRLPAARVAAGVLSLAALVVFLLSGDVRGQVFNYTTTDLTPANAATAFGNGISSGRQAGYETLQSTGVPVALVWSGTAASAASLNPSGAGTFTGSFAQGISGNQTVGYGHGNITNNQDHALLWTGTDPNPVDLNPVVGGSALSSSFAFGAAPNQQVGSGSGPGTNSNTHALLWSNTAASVVDLTPAGFTTAQARGTIGTRQIGFGFTGPSKHALLWTGSASTFTDLHPASGYSSSTGLGIGGNLEVGEGVTTGGQTHALLWTGASNTPVDLHPTGFTLTSAAATNGTLEVGNGFLTSAGVTHALLWTGTAAGYVDLQQFLPAAYISSVATGIDAAGNIIGTADLGSIGNSRAILWTVAPVPEPAALAAVGLGAFFLLRKRAPRSTR